MVDVPAAIGCGAWNPNAVRWWHGARPLEGMLNRVEALIRTFDPCLSCSTHAVGHMPLQVQLLAPDGELVEEIMR